MKPVEISNSNWEKLLAQLKKDHKPSHVITRSGMKKHLGFLPRHHRDFDMENIKYRKNCVMLDFYNEKKRTLFLIKYGEYFNE